MGPPCFNLSYYDCQVTQTLTTSAKLADDNIPCIGDKHGVDSANQAIGHIMEWCESNNLILNNEKSKEAQIKLSHSVTIQPVHDIEITDKFKILDITFTDKLSFARKKRPSPEEGCWCRRYSRVCLNQRLRKERGQKNLTELYREMTTIFFQV